jgi:hypothetical protein
MNKFLTWVVVATIIGAGIAANGWFVSQQYVNLFKAQEASFLSQMRAAADPNG